ncbi:MAG: CFI-box-CTERM domain-containing protein [Thermodesulfobacteriota bacterium]
MAKRRKSSLLPFLLILIPMQCILLPANSLANYLTLAWDPNTEPDLAGYRVYYGKSSGNYDHNIDVGNVVLYQLSDLDPDARYYVTLTAYDTFNNESDFSEEVSGLPVTTPSSPPPVQTSSEDGYTEWGCFIATAAYGSLWEPHVRALRDFRDHYLTKNQLGKSFIRDYYRYSPSIAQNIETNPSLKAAVRMSLTPLVLLSQYLVWSTLSDKIVYLLFVLCYSLCIFSWLLKNHPDI